MRQTSPVKLVRRIAVITVAAILLSACAAATFRENAEDFLRVSPVAYDTAMTFAKENKAKLPLETLKVFEAVRVQFPPAYRAFDSALAAWIAAGSKGDPVEVKKLQAEVDRLLKQLDALMVLNGGPNLNLGGKP